MNASLSARMQECIAACQTCLIDCKHCLAQMAGHKSMNDCPYCCVQCIEVLTASIGLMAVGSKFSAEQCALCARVCEYCAEQCEQHDHEHCRQCAASCRQCAELCRVMAN